MIAAAELLRKHGITLTDTKPDRYYTTCPRCSKDRTKPGHKAAKCLGVTIFTDGGFYWGCNHCPWSGGSGERRYNGDDLVAYDYVDADGALLFQKVRKPPGSPGDRFFVQRPDGRGGWIKNLEGVPKPRPLYRLSHVTAAIAKDCEIAIVEGEKDADRLWSIGIPATTNFDGATDVIKNPKARSKWKAEYSEALRGARIVVFNDNDGPGYAHADVVCKLSLGIAKRVRRLDLKEHWPDIPKGGDVSDWLAVGGEHTAEKLKALIEAAPDYVAVGGEPPPIDDDAEFEKLAHLSRPDYERARAEAAKRLGMRAAILDKLVAAKRIELGLDGDDNKQGRAIELPEPTPWETPVGGAELFDAIAKAIRKHVVLPDHSRDACTLWFAHTYLLDWLMITPRLAITSPTRGCGKTSLMDVAAALVFRPLPAANCSASSIFRVVEGFRPCLLIDEADSFLSANEELRGVLNSGHRRGGSVLRNVGDEHEPRSFSTFAACAIALIGQLPGTLADRSVSISLVRRKADEAIEPFRFDRVEHLAVLARKLMRWTKDNADTIAATEPQMPAGLYNRTADNWRPLIAIATVAGPDWLARSHTAALQCAGADVDEGSRLELLLGDIRDIFDAVPDDLLDPKAKRISSAELIEKLCEIEPRPWAEYGKSGKPITQNKLARLLKPLAIPPVQIRVGGEKTRGYERAQFEEAFARYLASEGVSNRYSDTNADNTGTSGTSATGTAEKPVPDGKREKSNDGGPCTGVPDGKGGNGHVRPNRFSAGALTDTCDWYLGALRCRSGEPNLEAIVDQALRERLVDKYDVAPADLETAVERVKKRLLEPLGQPTNSGLTIVGDCSQHASCKLCHGKNNVKRIKDNAIANCRVETLHETCAVGYFARLKDMSLN